MKRRHGVSRRGFCPISLHERRWARYEPPEAAQCEHHGLDEDMGAALEAARRPEARQLAHEQSEIQAAGLQQHALEDIAVSAQVHPAQAPGGVEMCIGTFEAFAAPTQQPLAASAANPPPVGIHRVWCNKAAEVGESAKQGQCEWLLP